jgi:hypothetical protein
MATELTSIKLPAELVDAARAESTLFSRSIGGQVEYWANIGRAFESTPGFTLDRVRAALAGHYDAALLSRDEAEIFDDLLGSAMDAMQTDEERKFWSEFKHEPNTDL